MDHKGLTNALQALSRQMLPAVEQEMRTILSAKQPPVAQPLVAQPLIAQPLVAEGTAPDRFYGMLHYHMGWVDAALQPTDGDVAGNGKRIRPLLCLLTCQAAARSAGEQGSGGAGEKESPLHPGTSAPLHAWRQALPAAAAVELLHNFSLIHDDIEDASPTRRGRPTLWKIWGVEQAINSGDALFALSHLALNRLVDRGVDAGLVVHALRRFDETCLRLTRGQHADMEFETRDEVSVGEYIEMITGKTAVLLSLCAELGALIAGCGDERVDHYAAFGRDLGLAFQVKDDILGIWGNEERIGKSAATDIVTRKKTLPVLYGLAQSEELRRLYRQPETGNGFSQRDFVQRDVVQRDVVQTVVELLEESGARDFASAKAAGYSQSALDHLEAAEPAGSAGTALYELAHMLLNRDF